MLLAGVSTRALAVSAARAGYAVTAIDAFGDVDLRAAARVVALTRAEGGFDPVRAARLGTRIAASAAAYTSNLENYPEAVALLSAGRRLLGNPPEVLRAVRDPVALMRAFTARGLPVPATRATAPQQPGRHGTWLVKPRRSGGGHGTAAWRPGAPVPRQAYLQERIHGVPGSIVFLAAEGAIHPLALTRQLVGRRAFGAAGFRYCGSLVGSAGATLFEDEPAVRRSAVALAETAAAAFRLAGLNGVDFIARDGIAWPTEVNPRPTASMELLERFGGHSIFELHARACDGRLPAAPPWAPVRGGVCGKAVVFARRDLIVSRAARRWRHLADIPHPGEKILRRHPICTVFATGRDATACLRALAARAQQVYASLESAAGRAGAA